MPSNGYIVKYVPDHPRAYSNGTVYEHILVAEQMLGRVIKPGEEVHHIDHCKTNNSPENIMVFESEASHAAFHGGHHAEQNEDGTYRCFKYGKDGEKVYFTKDPIRKKYCIDCGAPIRHTSTRCRECNFKFYRENYIPRANTRKVIRPSKEELETLILTKSMLEIGRMYKISDNAVRKWCKYYGLPYKKNDINKLRENLILS